MSLIKCTMCHKDISPNAVSCPHCGEPMKVDQPEDCRYKLILKSAGREQMKLIQLLQREVGFTLKECADVVQGAPSTVKECTTLGEATALMRTLEVYGVLEIEKVNKSRQTVEVVEKSQSKDIVCTNCGSNNTSRISGANKVASGFLFGIFSANKLKSSWQCKSCGYKW